MYSHTCEYTLTYCVSMYVCVGKDSSLYTIREVTALGVPVFKSSSSTQQHRPSKHTRSESSDKQKHPVPLYTPYYEDLRYS